MTRADFKLYIDGIDKLMEQINQATEQFNELQKAINHELDHFENSLRGRSKDAFVENSQEIKAGFISQYNILTDARKTGLDAKETLKVADANIAEGIVGS